MNAADLDEEIIQRWPGLITAISQASSITVLTGAGVSAESGIPTFRQAQTGLWEKYRPDELATPQAFAANPHLVWQWYTWRRGLVRQALPNPGHYALARLELILQERHGHFCLVTQNVDGLHQAAGSRNVVELHGNILRTKCSREGTAVDTWEESPELPPRCPNCGSYLRPDVVWFGESLPGEAIQKAWECASICDVLFSVGTSAVVEPAASIPYLAARRGATVVEINPMETPLSREAAYSLRGESGKILPALLRMAFPHLDS